MEIGVEGSSSIHDDHAGGFLEAGLRLPGHAFYCGLLGEEILGIAANKTFAAERKKPRPLKSDVRPKNSRSARAIKGEKQ